MVPHAQTRCRNEAKNVAQVSIAGLATHLQPFRRKLWPNGKKTHLNRRKTAFGSPSLPHFWEHIGVLCINRCRILLCIGGASLVRIEPETAEKIEGDCAQTYTEICENTVSSDHASKLLTPTSANLLQVAEILHVFFIVSEDVVDYTSISTARSPTPTPR